MVATSSMTMASIPDPGSSANSEFKCVLHFTKGLIPLKCHQVDTQGDVRPRRVQLRLAVIKDSIRRDAVKWTTAAVIEVSFRRHAAKWKRMTCILTHWNSKLQCVLQLITDPILIDATTWTRTAKYYCKSVNEETHTDVLRLMETAAKGVLLFRSST